MPTPVYTPREQGALRTAHSIVMRVHVRGEWRQSPAVQEEGEALADAVVRVQQHVRHASRHTPGSGADRVMVCVVGRDPTDTTDFIVPMPRDHLPAIVRSLLP